MRMIPAEMEVGRMKSTHDEEEVRMVPSEMETNLCLNRTRNDKNNGCKDTCRSKTNENNLSLNRSRNYENNAS